MGSATEPTTGTEEDQLVKMEEEEQQEDEQVFELERKSSSFHHGKGPYSGESSTITTTNTSSSSSFTGDGTYGIPAFRNVEGENTATEDLEVTESPEQETEIALVISSETVEVKAGDFHLELDFVDQSTGGVIDVEDYDVEKVLDNQETHDLFCPNCNACITKKVVLKRRKRMLLHELDDPKRSRIDPLLRSEDNLPSANAGENTVPVSFVFKCLSCFSLFRSSVPQVSPEPLPPSESAVELDTQPRPQEEEVVGCNWFPFGFKKDRPALEQGGTEADPPHNNPNGEETIDSTENNSSEAQVLVQVDAVTATEEISVSEDTNHVGTSLIKADGGDISDSPTPEVALEEGTLTVPLLRPVVEGRKLEVLKSIVYGGLIESITSLGVISSAAGSGASTLNILVLGLANLFGGLIVIIHNLQELREEEPIRTTGEDNGTNGQEVEGRYKRLLGRKDNFTLHATVAILSFIIVGLLPPVVYYFSFSKTHNRDYKVVSVFGSSLLCIVLLAIAKAHVKIPRGSYLKSVLYYATTAVPVSGISYLVGNFVEQLLEKYGWSDGSETPAGHMILSLFGRKGGSFGYSSSY